MCFPWEAPCRGPSGVNVPSHSGSLSFWADLYSSSICTFLALYFWFFFLRFKPDHKTEISIYIFLCVCLSSKYIFKVLSSHLIATEEYYSQKKENRTEQWESPSYKLHTHNLSNLHLEIPALSKNTVRSSVKELTFKRTLRAQPACIITRLVASPKPDLSRSLTAL